MTTNEAITILRTTLEENIFNGKPTSDAQKRLYEAMLMGEVALKREQWIPCSERMPEPEHEVLIKTVANCYTVGEFLGNDFLRGCDCWLFANGEENGRTKDVKEWREIE